MVAQNQKELQHLHQDLVDLREQRSSGGHFPWTWLILAGGAYALYHSNPAVREQVQGLLDRMKGASGDVSAMPDRDDARPLAVVEQVALDLQHKKDLGPDGAAEDQSRH
ncbi:hypothetical protein [Deinococcus ficus]|uniref:hypothetical protein n=1 Tax=Deinococcus ficus TaxID=317577 RepID=UPI0003B76557|nr:hypothetical protein [Deinococcus ficus]